MINSADKLPILEKLIFNYKNGENKISIFPTIHDNLPFSAHIRNVINEIKPKIIALELPIELENELNIAINRLPTYSLIMEKNQEKSLTQSYVVHPGEVMYWSCFIGKEHKIPVTFIDNLHENMTTIDLDIDYYHIASVGWQKFWDIRKDLIGKQIDNIQHLKRSLNMANKIQNYNDVLLICGASHLPIIHQILLNNGYSTNDISFDYILIPKVEHNLVVSKVKNWDIVDIHPNTLHLSSNDLPFHIANMINKDLTGDTFDELLSIRNIFFRADKIYKEKFDDQINLGSYIRLFQYLRNLCLISNKIKPDLYDMILSAKGMVDDDFAYEVFKIAIKYPFPNTKPLERMIKFQPNEKQGEVINFAFKRRYKRPVLKEVEREDFDPIPTEDFPGQWKEIWDNYSKDGYVSYPPEDEYLERYIRFLEKKIQEVLMEEQSSTEEFSSSLEDGIDWRETISKFHEKKIYVKKYPKQIPQIGCMIVQFIEEPLPDEFNYYSTLYSEHAKESHISILTTEVGKEFIGPGISRVKYAAIISQFPPLGIPVRIPFSNDDLKLRLIYTAMNMSLSNIIGFISPKPPTAAHKFFASQYGFRLIYLPMMQLNKSSMNRLRTMHLLANRSLRDDASEYIGF